MTPASAHLLFRFTSPKNRNFIFSVKQTGVPIGWTLMALVAPPITVAFGWRWALLVVLMVALATMLALQSVRTRWDDDRYTRTTVQQRPFDGLRLVWRYPVLRWVSASSLFLTFVQLCLSTFAVTMLVEEAGYSLVAAGFILSLVQASGIAGHCTPDRSTSPIRLPSTRISVFCGPVTPKPRKSTAASAALFP